MTANSERGISRLLEKLEASVNSGEYYEAHQMYRTLYFRYLKQKKYEDLLSLLYKGAIFLLQNDQQGSGSDLAVLFVDVLNKSNTKPTEELIEKIAKLYEMMNITVPERATLLNTSIKWSMDSNKKGHPLLHKRFGEIFFKEKSYSSSHKHFLLSNDGCAYAKVLIEMQTKDAVESEVDLCIAEAVLRLLCLRNPLMARETFTKYTALHPALKNEKGPPYKLPFMNFLWYLIKAIEEQNIEQFKQLKDKYASSIKRDPNYSVYVDKIGRKWFNIQPPQQKNSSAMFSGLLKSFMGDLDIAAKKDLSYTSSSSFEDTNDSSTEETNHKNASSSKNFGVPDLD